MIWLELEPLAKTIFDFSCARQQPMKRFKGLMRDTWWVWTTFVVGGAIAGRLISFIFYSAIPISFFAFFYFAILRYDDDGNPTDGSFSQGG